jgi:hypothetical protein
VTRAYGWTFRELVSGRLEARSANALGALLGGLLAAVKSGDIEARLEALERALVSGEAPR